MRTCLYALFAVIAANVIPIAAHSAAPDAEPIRHFDSATIETLGQAIYAQDQEAWSATEILMARRRGLDVKGLEGWIVVTTDTGDRVRFIRVGNGTLAAAYDVLFAKDAEPVFLVPQDNTLTAGEVAQHNARNLALKNIGKACSEHYNTVALPDPDAEGWLVWALAATTDPDAILLGGHIRFSVSQDGKTINAKDALSRSCLSLNTADSPKGADPAAFIVTHLVSDEPLETHVFLSLQHRLDLFVVTEKALWKVSHGHVEKVEDRDPPPAQP